VTGSQAHADGHGRIYQASGDQHITEHHHHDAAARAGPDTVRIPAVARPPLVLRGRAAEMDRLRAAVGPGAGGRVFVLHGLGGCGKTAVACTLFQHAVTQAGRVGLWVNASDAASLRTGMLAVAADRGASDAELAGARSGLRPAADLVWHYLDQSARPWLLVLDNADTPAIVRDGGWLRASPVGTVVVTSRQSGAHWWLGAELVPFGVLPREDAALVLRDLAPDAGSTEDAAAVADRLGGLPLALTLAGGFLSRQVISPWTLADYRSRLDGGDLDPVELIDQGSAMAGEDDPRHLVSRTWQLSLDALAAQGLPEAASLLGLLACWADDPLPLPLLSGATAPGLPAARVEPALRGLLDQSLTGLVTGPVRCLRTHGVVLDSVARGIIPGDRDEIAAAAAQLLASALPEIPHLRRQDPGVTLLAPHVLALIRRATSWELPDTTVQAAAECGLRLVTALHRSGDYASALSLAAEAEEHLRRRLGADNILVIRIRHRIGCALHRLGRVEESLAVHRQVLAQCEETLGPEAPDTLEACRKICRPLYVLGRESEGAELIQRAVAGRVKFFGNLHPLTLLARAHLLGYVIVPGLREVVETGPELLTDCRNALTADHQITVRAEHDYAFALGIAGRPAEALPHILTALAGYQEHFDSDHPLMLNPRTAHSQILAALGQGHSQVTIRSY
jgi:hypothetical protein